MGRILRPPGTASPSSRPISLRSAAVGSPSGGALLAARRLPCPPTTARPPARRGPRRPTRRAQRRAERVEEIDLLSRLLDRFDADDVLAPLLLPPGEPREALRLCVLELRGV